MDTVECEPKRHTVIQCRTSSVFVYERRCYSLYLLLLPLQFGVDDCTDMQVSSHSVCLKLVIGPMLYDYSGN